MELKTIEEKKEELGLKELKILYGDILWIKV